MKKLGLLSMALCVVMMCCVSCKSKQNAYKAAYEQAKEREMTNSEPVEEQIAPVTKAKTSTATRQEKITPVCAEIGRASCRERV